MSSVPANNDNKTWIGVILVVAALGIGFSSHGARKGQTHVSSRSGAASSGYARNAGSGSRGYAAANAQDDDPEFVAPHFRSKADVNSNSFYTDLFNETQDFNEELARQADYHASKGHHKWLRGYMAYLEQNIATLDRINGNAQDKLRFQKELNKVRLQAYDNPY